MNSPSVVDEKSIQRTIEDLLEADAPAMAKKLLTLLEEYRRLKKDNEGLEEKAMAVSSLKAENEKMREALEELKRENGELRAFPVETASLVENGAPKSIDWKVPTPELEGSFPVVLYFAEDAERIEFIEMVKQAKPHMVTKAL